MIVRRRKNRNFTVVGNEVFDDERLSLAALGLLAWLRSKPDNWQLHVEHIRKRFDLGRDKAYGVIKELVDAGWIHKTWVRQAGTFAKVEYVVLDEPKPVPLELPFPEKPETVGAQAVAEPSQSENEGGEQPFPGSPYPAEPYPAQPYPENPDAVIRTDPSTSTEKRANTPPPPSRGALDQQSSPSEPGPERAGRRERRADRKAGTPCSSAPAIWVHADSDNGRAWEAHLRARGEKPPWKQTRTGYGWYFHTARPPPPEPPDRPAPGQEQLAL